MKIYVVTSGEYSDYHIETVCSSFELAEQFIKNNENPDELKKNPLAPVVNKYYDYEENVDPVRHSFGGYSIEEYDLDANAEKRTTYHEVYHYIIEADSGNERTTMYHSIGMTHADSYPYKGYRGQWKVEYSTGFDAVRCIVGESVVSMEHAKKLAVEGRQAWLRKGKVGLQYEEGEPEVEK